MSVFVVWEHEHGAVSGGGFDWWPEEMEAAARDAYRHEVDRIIADDTIKHADVRLYVAEPPADEEDVDSYVFERFEVSSGSGFEPLESYTKGEGTL